MPATNRVVAVTARQQFIELVNATDVSLARLALLAVQILKGDNAATQSATKVALEQLDSLVVDARGAGCEESLERLVAYLGSDRGYAGNTEDYYSADNSDLSLVLERKRGIPITLAIIYIEIGWALGFDLRGIGFPGHFLVGHFLPAPDAPDAPEAKGTSGGVVGVEAGLVDPFTGKLTDRTSCLENLARVSSDSGVSRKDWPQAQVDAWFLPSTSLQIALRLLENLKQIYVQTGAHGDALAALDLQLLVAPESFELLQQQKALSAQIFGRKDTPPVH